MSLGEMFKQFSESTLNSYNKQLLDTIMQGMLCFGTSKVLDLLNNFLDELTKSSFASKSK